MHLSALGGTTPPLVDEGALNSSAQPVANTVQCGLEFVQRCNRKCSITPRRIDTLSTEMSVTFAAAIACVRASATVGAFSIAA